MSRPWIAGDGQQQALLPVDAGAWLPADHPALALWSLVAELDVSAFEGYYRADGRGRPPYPPRMMLALVLYCRSKGFMSGRRIAAACHDDLGARLITGNRYPDRSTIDAFLNVHAAAIKAVLAQTLRLGQPEGLLDVSVLAGDGTKVLAGAAMGATVTEAELAGQITELDRRLAAAEAAWQQQVTRDAQPPLWDGAEPDAAGIAVSCGPDTDTARAWRTMGTLTRMRQRRQAALAYLHAHPGTAVTDWQQRLDGDRQRVGDRADRLATARARAAAQLDRHTAAAAAGNRLPGSKPATIEDYSQVRRARAAWEKATARAQATAAADPPTSKVNTTDPTSRIMPGKHDGYGQRHNVQALASRRQFIIAIATHPNANDKQALTSLIHRGRANLDAAAITETIGAVLADNGYASEDNFTAELPVDLLLIAVDKEKRQTGRAAANPEATPHPGWQIMAQRLDNPDNRALYKQRAAIIEPLFAQLFARFGRVLNARGEQVEVELHLWAVTHNLLKIARARRSRPG